jgi:hypothetical protein
LRKLFRDKKHLEGLLKGRRWVKVKARIKRLRRKVKVTWN